MVDVAQLPLYISSFLSCQPCLLHDVSAVGGGSRCTFDVCIELYQKNSLQLDPRVIVVYFG